MGIESSNRASHRTAHQILLRVQIHQGRDSRLQYRLDHVTGNDRLRDHALPSTLNPVDRSRLLVRAIVARQRQHDHARVMLLHNLKRLFSALGNHVHAHRITRRRREPNKERPTSHGGLQALQLRKPRGALERLLERFISVLRVDPQLRIGGHRDRREINGRSTCHAILDEDSGHSSTGVERFAASGSRRDEGAFSGSHGYGIQVAVDVERSRDTEGQRNVADNVFATGTKHSRIIVVSQWNIGGFECLRLRCTS